MQAPGTRRTIRARRVRGLIFFLAGWLCLPVHPTGAATPGAGEWPFAARDYANTRYSELGQIMTANAASLKVAFTFSTGVLRGHEAAPVVVGSTMFIVTPYPNIVYALDLSRPGATVKWKFEPKPLAAAQGVAC